MKVNRVIFEGMMLEGFFNKLLDSKWKNYIEVDATQYKSKFQDAFKKALNKYLNGKLKSLVNQYTIETKGSHIILKIKDLDNFYNAIDKLGCDSDGYYYADNIADIQTDIYGYTQEYFEKDNNVKLRYIDSDEDYEEYAIMAHT